MHGRTRSGSAPSSSKIARAKPHQVVSPPPSVQYALRRARRRRRSGGQLEQPGGQVGRPGRRPPLIVHNGQCVPLRSSRAMVFTKLPPARRTPTPVRTTHDRAPEPSTAPRPPASSGRSRRAARRFVDARTAGRRRRGRRSPSTRGSAARRRDAHAAASTRGPSAFTANARSSSFSAASTAVYAAALITTGAEPVRAPGPPARRPPPAPARRRHVQLGRAGRDDVRRRAARSAARSRPSWPEPPGTSSQPARSCLWHSARPAPSAAPTTRGCRGTRPRSRARPSSKDTCGA